jgi:16S rRNA (uracil1498-N3)-methyltransferase
VRARVEMLERGERVRRAWVWCGAPEGERGDWLVEKLAELGIERFQPVDLERGSWRGTARRLERWRRLAVAALRQSRRRFLMKVEAPLPLEAALAGRPGGGVSLWLAAACARPGSAIAAPATGVAIGLIGPAGGLSGREERSLETSGFNCISLADARLRTETAAIAWAAWWAVGG